MFSNGSDFQDKFEIITDQIAPVVTGYTTRIRDLLTEFDGKIMDLLKEYNNNLIFESDKNKLFYDQLSEDETKKYNDYLANQAKAEAEAKANAEAFKLFKQSLVDKHVNNTDPTVD